MDSIIWGLDLLAVAYLCLWALRQDGGMKRNDAQKNALNKNHEPKD